MDETEKNIVAAAIDALNLVLTSDVSPRLASKVVRFKKILSDYIKQNQQNLQKTIDFENVGKATDSNGKEIADIYTV